MKLNLNLQLFAETMEGKDAISGSMAKCFITIENNRYNFMNAIKIEAKVDKTKTKVPILGKTGKGNKATGWEGTGSATFHFNNSVLRTYLERYARTGEDFYFDMQLVNGDPTSQVGKQTIVLIGCNIDGAVLAKFDADADYLEEDMDFTFEDYKMPDAFTNLPGMVL